VLIGGRCFRVERTVISHLAKNERDMGLPGGLLLIKW
jgi:hypothetical protein